MRSRLQALTATRAGKAAAALAVVVLAAGVTVVVMLTVGGAANRDGVVAQGVGPAPLATRVAAEADDSPSISGIFVSQHAGRDGIYRNADDRDHLPANGTMPICTTAQLAANDMTGCYNSNPPTSGMHTPAVARWGVIVDGVVPKEALVHNMEHGGVVVWHNTSDAALIAAMAAVVTSAVADGRLVVMSRYDGMEPETIAFTSWTRLDKFPARDYTEPRLRYFIRDNERRFNPEGF